MKSLVVYSSKTGNTKKVAEAIYKVMPVGTDFCSVDEIDSFDKYDFIAFGCWIDKKTADKKALKKIDGIKNKEVGIFATLGAYPDSQHAIEAMDSIRKLFIENQNKIATEFICQGRIDPAITERFKKLPADNSHFMSPEKIKMHEDAYKHPDVVDLKNASEAFQEAIEKCKV